MDEIEMSEIEKEKRAEFTKFTDHQMKVGHILFLSIFGGIGIILMMVGIILFALYHNLEGPIIASYVTFGLGFFFGLIGIILFKAVPWHLDYDKIKKNIDIFPERKAIYGRFFDDKDEKMALLENKINELQKKINELENKK